MFADLTGDASGSYPSSFTVVGSRMFFRAATAAGSELWVTDGTVPGTTMVADIAPGNLSSYPSNLVNLGSILLFSADDGVNGVELWRSDGSGPGTTMVAGIYAGSQGSNIANAMVVNGVMFFTAHDGLTGQELWRSDGTLGGTMRVIDAYPGPVGGMPNTFYPILNHTGSSGSVLFGAHDSLNGNELWETGSSAGAPAALLDDITGDSRSSNPMNFTVSGPRVFFTANNNSTGYELWAIDLADLASNSVPAIFWTLYE
jgi:ELWxxDGT repeat protein